MKFIAKPVVVGATRWFCDGDHKAVKQRDIEEAEPNELVVHRMFPCCQSVWEDHGIIEGPQIVCPGDWIVTGAKGQVSACKPGIFEMTYGGVEEVVEIRDISDEEAEPEVMEMFSSMNGELYYSKISEKLNLDYDQVIRICDKLMKDCWITLSD